MSGRTVTVSHAEAQVVQGVLDRAAALLGGIAPEAAGLCGRMASYFAAGMTIVVATWPPPPGPSPPGPPPPRPGPPPPEPPP